MKTANIIALALVIVGGINWGLVGLLHLDLVATLLGVDTIATRTVYALVGLAAIYSITLFRPVSIGTTRSTLGTPVGSMR